jgi:hypothetical protein
MHAAYGSGYEVNVKRWAVGKHGPADAPFRWTLHDFVMADALRQRRPYGGRGRT